MANLLKKLEQLRQQHSQAKVTVTETQKAVMEELYHVQSHLRLGSSTGDNIRDWAILQFGLDYNRIEKDAKEIERFLQGKQGKLVALYEDHLSDRILRKVRVGHLSQNPIEIRTNDNGTRDLLIRDQGSARTYTCSRELNPLGKLEEIKEDFYGSRLCLTDLVSADPVVSPFGVYGNIRKPEFHLTSRLELNVGERIFRSLESIWEWGNPKGTIPPLYQRWEEGNKK